MREQLGVCGETETENVTNSPKRDEAQRSGSLVMLVDVMIAATLPA